MINFRYHLVSVAAVLLALAAGIALGAGPLEDAAPQLGNDSDNASADPALSAFETGYAGRTFPALVKGKLDKQQVVVVTLPGARAAEVKGVTVGLQRAGASITGQIALTAKLVDPANRQFAEGVAQQSATGVPAVTTAASSYGRVGAALARSILGKGGAALDQTASTIESAFVEGGLVEATTAPSTFARLVVVVAGPGRSESGELVSQIVGALDAAGAGAVVAGPSTSSAEDGLLEAVRSSDAASRISTVDVTDVAAGQAVVSLALARELAGQAGSWGTARSADGALPK